ncbi:MAG: HXXEE domain-containing protein [Bacteroidota bacterium]
MKTSTPLLTSILLLFLMLWAPLGQYEFLIEHWMKIGTYSIPFVGIGIFAFKDIGTNMSLGSNLRFLALIMLVAYFFHQFEEHWVDLFGNHYAFYSYNNNFILSALGQPNALVKPLTKESIFVINTSLVWLVGLLSLSRSPRHLFPFFAMASIVLINGVVHIVGGMFKFRYNPGLFTSIVIFIPLYFWIIKQVRHRVTNFGMHVVLGLIWAFLAHVIMVAGLLFANWYKVIPEYLFWIALVFWSIIPMAILRKDSIKIS